MKASEVKEMLEFTEKIYSNLGNYIETYVEWVKRNIPVEYWDDFGVNETYESRGGSSFDFVGFGVTTYPVLFGKGVYWNGMFREPMPRSFAVSFAAEIPSIIEKGMSKIKEFGDKGTKVLESKVDFKDINS